MSCAGQVKGTQQSTASFLSKIGFFLVSVYLSFSLPFPPFLSYFVSCWTKEHFWQHVLLGIWRRMKKFLFSRTKIPVMKGNNSIPDVHKFFFQLNLIMCLFFMCTWNGVWRSEDSFGVLILSCQLWDLAIELRLSGLYAESLYPLSHLSGPTNLSNAVLYHYGIIWLLRMFAVSLHHHSFPCYSSTRSKSQRQVVQHFFMGQSILSSTLLDILSPSDGGGSSCLALWSFSKTGYKREWWC